MVREMVEEDKPLAYVLGTQPFHPLPVDLLVRPPTLIPRPETEHWVSLLTERILAVRGKTARNAEPFRILDIGTGTGCIALALTHGLSRTSEGRANGPFAAVRTLAVDRAESAVRLAKENARRCGLPFAPRGGEGRTGQANSDPSAELPNDPSTPDAPSAAVSVHQADLFSPSFSSTVFAHLQHIRSSDSLANAVQPPGFDLVVSNPPYIPLHEYATLDRSVREWEDRGALVGETAERPLVPRSKEDDGLVFYRRIVSLLEELLAEGGEGPVVAFEVGKGQARDVERMLREWRGTKGAQLETKVIEDPWGIGRAVFAGWKR
ncbi:Release factor glutamine methyltransferase [Rhodotorula toruloides]|nr:Release factor glutamine methyltransferase [Rhodotorula toruloides]